MTLRIAAAAAIVIASACLLPHTATAQTIVQQAAEHRLQLDFRVNDAALAKMLPQGWEPAIATEGPAKDCNLRMIFIDQMGIVGGDGKPASYATAQLVYLAIPVKHAASGAAG